MKYNLYFFTMLAASFLALGALAEDLYIAQTAQGSDSGIDAANAHSVAWFNTASNWGAGAGKISPGDTAHLVGTITSVLTAQTSGTSGNRITILFEPGASISMPSIPTTGGIVLNSLNWLTIDGGQNGVIENTANGSGMGQLSSRAINGTPNAGNITIQNLTIRNLYVRTNQADAVSPIGIYLYGVMSNLMVSSCSFTWCHQGVALLYGVGNSSNFQVVSNHFNYLNHGTIFGSGNNGGAILTGANWDYNQADYFGDWDQPGANAYHHNGFYAWADHTGAIITNISVTHNIVGGHFGNSTYGTSGVYLSAAPGVGVFNLLFANNVVSFTAGGANDGALYLFNVKDSLVANNTFYDSSSTYNGVRCDPTCTGVTFSNNIFSGFALNYYLVPGSTTRPAYCDNNIYKGGQFRVDSTYNSFASWKALGYDANSKTNDPLFKSAATADYTLTSTSPAIGMAVNLSPTFTTDINSVTRPATGAWTVGAYEYAAGIVNTNPSVSAISANASDVAPGTAGFQIYGGTVVQLSAIAANNQAYQWSYTVNGGLPVKYQNGSGAVAPASFTYSTNTIGNSYIWTLTVSNGLASAQAMFALSVVATPTNTPGLVFAAQLGQIAAPFVTASTVVNGITNNYIYQPLQSTEVTNGGSATYNFTISNDASYVIQAFVNAPDGGVNSFFVSIDDQPQNPSMVWDVTPTSGFEQRFVSWRGAGTDTANEFVPKYFKLTAGSHQVIFRGREANTQLSRFAILQVPPKVTGLHTVP